MHSAAAGPAAARILLRMKLASTHAKPLVDMPRKRELLFT
jgi:hypothetical protein